jgi:hypothetical protein
MLHYGARALVRRLTAARIEHVYEEFPDDHNNTDYRLDVSLPYLYAALERGAARGRLIGYIAPPCRARPVSPRTRPVRRLPARVCRRARPRAPLARRPRKPVAVEG